MSVFDYKRRPTVSVNVGGIPLGSDHPIRIQSMTSTSTMDTDASVAQCMRIAAAGADYIRLTAQGVREAENLGVISEQMRRQCVDVPLIADIHFNPKAAFTAARMIEKVRINPGNFVDPGRTFVKLDFTDEEYAEEIKKIERTLVPFLELCRQHNTAIRIGVNHGSLSDRIMSRYGDTPAGMVESAMEFLRVCVAHDFMDVVISIKASNVAVMVETVRRLVAEMDREDMHFPLHLGVTEAGDGDDGRIKSAVGIGTLLAEGIGDTIRVSLSEDPEREVPVAAALVEYIGRMADAEAIEGEYAPGYDPIRPERRRSTAAASAPIGGGSTPAVGGLDIDADTVGSWPRIDAPASPEQILQLTEGVAERPIVITTASANFSGTVAATLHAMMAAEITNPVMLYKDYGDTPADMVRLQAAVDFGALLMNGFADGLMIDSATMTRDELDELALSILQAARLRISHTEFISCPGCGRTMFDLQTTLAQVREATRHLTGLKIGVMGCIVNGPGEMADADYGYVGAAAGKVTLYKGRTPIEKNIPASEAIPRLIALIKEGGDWVDPVAE